MTLDKDCSFVVSVILLLVSLYAYKKAVFNWAATGIMWLLILLSGLLLIGYRIADYFTGEGITEAVIYHLRSGVEGAGFREYGLLIAVSVLGVLVFSAIILVFMVKFRKSGRAGCVKYGIAYALGLLSLAANPAVWDLNSLVVIPLTSKFYDSRSPRAEGIEKNASGFSSYYKVPVRKAALDQMNLVVIYAESLERTYFDESIFPGLIQNFKQIERISSYNFTNISQTKDSAWTIGGMVASQCGIPLITPSYGNSMSGMDKFLPLAVCLGDILKRDGYYLEYIGGASIKFSGKDKFYKTHGFDKALGYKELMSEIRDINYRNGWGLYDDTLFDIVYERFLDLSRKKAPFGLFTLTLDTHHPKGHMSRSCDGMRYGGGKNPILNAVACSDYLISRVVRRIRSSPYGDRTIIVIVSDHLALRNTAGHLLEKGKRRNLFMVLDPRVSEHTDVPVSGTTLDVGATLLSLLGYQGELGLGRNLLDEIYSNERDIILNQLENWRKELMGLWAYPKIEEYIEVDPGGEDIVINGRHFRIPVLIEINDGWEAILRFGFDLANKKRALPYQAKELIESKQSFILIDKCNNIRVLGLEATGYDYCLLASSKGRYRKLQKLNGRLRLTTGQITAMLDSTVSTNTGFSAISTLAIGQEVDFNAKGSGLTFLGNGWSEPEEWGIWSNSKSASLAFKILDVIDSDINLIINGRGYVNELHPKQYVDIIANGVKLKKIVFWWKKQKTPIIISIPKPVIALNNGLVHLEFKFNNPVSPKKLGKGNDGRLLGFGLVSLRIEKAVRSSQDRLLGNGFSVRRVAHAGGGINGIRYTNSIDALNENIKKGFEYFEIDFSFTKDKKLVCLHDWGKNFKNTFGILVRNKITLADFEKLVERSKLKNCTLATLADWMKKHPSAKIVTDIKEKNLQGLYVMLHSLPNSMERIIPQVYQPESIPIVKGMGFKKIIWTLYKYSGINGEVLDWILRDPIDIAVTMPKDRAKTRLPLVLRMIGVPVYVHTVNSESEACLFFSRYAISEIYTDFLSPDNHKIMEDIRDNMYHGESKCVNRDFPLPN